MPRMITIPRSLLAFLRARVARRTRERRVKTPEEAVRFVSEVGFCFFWPIKDVELPNLFHAIAGRVRPVPMAHDDPDIGRSWGWKDDALGKRKWYYGKLLARRATLVSRELLPYFYALSPNYGDDTEYLGEYEAGLLTLEARNIYEALVKGGAMDTVRLRREAHLAAESAKTRFERALTELQVMMRILPVGVAEAGAWRYAFVYELLTRHFPDETAQARAISRSQAQARLANQYLDNMIAATRADVARVFSVFQWTSKELDRALSGLVERGLARPGRVEGSQDEYFVSSRAWRSGRRASGR